jgi:hypothetical protein
MEQPIKQEKPVIDKEVLKVKIADKDKLVSDKKLVKK